MREPRDFRKIRTKPSSGSREVNFPLAGYAGPGFHTWPGSADVLVGEYESGDSHPVPCQKDVQRDVRRRDRGQRPTATKKSGSETTTQGSLLPDEGLVLVLRNIPMAMPWAFAWRPVGAEVIALRVNAESFL